MAGCVARPARFGHVPVLTVFQGEPGRAAEKGCILFFHGLGASKDVQRPDLESLAAQGYLVVGIDSVGHGERRYPDFNERLSKANPDFTREFLTVVLETAKEVPFLLDELERAGLVRNGRVGVAGISQGGFITYTAVTLEPRLKVAAAIVGSPEWPLRWAESPHLHLEAFNRVFLLSQNAGKDDLVPSRCARDFHRRLERVYLDDATRFVYAEYAESDHLLEADWSTLWARTLAWFDRHIDRDLNS